MIRWQLKKNDLNYLFFYVRINPNTNFTIPYLLSFWDSGLIYWDYYCDSRLLQPYRHPYIMNCLVIPNEIVSL